MCVCPEYRRLSRAYQRALIAWGEPKKINRERAIDADLEVLERKYRLLMEHQHSCAVCSAELGQTVGPR
jgi:hypothetical protein